MRYAERTDEREEDLLQNGYHGKYGEIEDKRASLTALGVKRLEPMMEETSHEIEDEIVLQRKEG